MRKFLKSHVTEPWKVLNYTWVLLVVGIIGSGAGCSIAFWDTLSEGEGTPAQSISALGIMIGGAVAIVLGTWRSIEGSKQVRASEGQLANAERVLLNDRYQRAVELLGSTSRVVRLGGLHALQSLADSNAQDYHVLVMGLLCAFVQEARNRPGNVDGAAISGDSQEAMRLIVETHRRHLDVESEARFHLPLRGTYLVGADLDGADFSTAPPIIDFPWSNFEVLHAFGSTDLSLADLRRGRLSQAKMTDVNLNNADLSGAVLLNTDLSGASLLDADLSGAMINGAMLTGTKFHADAQFGTRGMRQSDLDSCRARRSGIPTFDGVRDVVTGLQLYWSGETLDG